MPRDSQSSLVEANPSVSHAPASSIGVAGSPSSQGRSSAVRLPARRARVAAGLLLLAVLAALPAHAAGDIQRQLAEVYARQGETELLADVYRPSDGDGHPGVLLIHGGGWVSGSRLHMLVHANALARAGYVVVAIDYRLAPRHRYPAQLDDCRLALAWMQREADELGLDAQRVAVFGYSAGGQLACMLGLRPHEPAAAELPKIRAIVAGGAPCDFTWLPENSLSLVPVFGKKRSEAPELYREASPLQFVSADDPPVFLYHGAADLLVPVASARRLHERLRELNVPSELLEVEGQGHLGTFVDPEPLRQTIAFLDRVLK